MMMKVSSRRVFAFYAAFVAFAAVVFGGASTDQDFPDFSDTKELQNLLASTWEDNKMVLTKNEAGKNGAVWMRHPVPVAGIDTFFTFQITAPRPGQESADGFAFVIQKGGIQEYGDFDGGLGYGSNQPLDSESTGKGIKASVAIEFDTLENKNFDDRHAPHVSVHVSGPDDMNLADESTNPNPSPGKCFFDDLAWFNDGRPHTVRLLYEPKEEMLSMWWDGRPRPSMNCPLNLEEALGVEKDERVYVGFTASTDLNAFDANGNNLAATHEILNWNIAYAGKLDIKNSHAEGPGAGGTTVAGKSIKFDIFTQSGYGWPMSVGGWELEGSMTPPNVPVTITDKDDGTYSASYKPTKSGSFEVVVRYDFDKLGGGPYKITVDPDTIDIGHCTASGTATKGGTAGDTLKLTIQGKDKYDNNVKDDGKKEMKAVLVDGSSEVLEVVAEPDGRGKWKAEFPWTVAGDFKLKVKSGFTEVKGSPFGVTVKPGPVCPDMTSVEGEMGGAAGDDHSFVIQARDDYANDIHEGGEDCKIEVKRGPARIKPTCVDNDDGTYTVTYTTETSGWYDFYLWIGDALVGSSAHKVHVEPGAIAVENTLVIGDSTRQGYAGDANPFYIQTKDGFGNPLESGGEEFEVFLIGGDPEERYPVKVTDSTNGQYPGSYTPSLPGYWLLETNYIPPGTVEPLPLVGSPFNVSIVAGRAYGPNSASEGSGLSEAWQDRPVAFNVHTCDRAGNVKTYGEDDFELALVDPKTGTVYDDEASIEHSVDDKMDGNYVIQYIPHVHGSLNLRVTLNGDELQGSPFPVYIEYSGVHPAVSVVIGLGGVGSVASIFIFTYRAKRRRAELLAAVPRGDGYVAIDDEAF